MSLRATASSERRQTVPSFGSAVGAEAAVNADFFSFETYAPSGAAMHAGASWRDDTSGSGFLAFGRERFELSAPSAVVDPMHGWAREVVGGHPMILRNGEIVSSTSSLCTARHPRTAAGISRDRQTLYLLVVDGRSTSAIGMTCAEEAAILRELGAYHALNLDGGGSSTMWVRGTGVVNAPSDGSPRVVSNHLAIEAAGAGLPGSCMPWEPEESEWLGAQHDEAGTSDLDGDGRADACARGADGVACHLSTGAAFATEAVAGPGLSDASGWGAARHWATIALGDVTGDGLADLCARARGRPALLGLYGGARSTRRRSPGPPGRTTRDGTRPRDGRRSGSPTSMETAATTPAGAATRGSSARPRTARASRRSGRRSPRSRTRAGSTRTRAGPRSAWATSTATGSPTRARAARRASTAGSPRGPTSIRRRSSGRAGAMAPAGARTATTRPSGSSTSTATGVRTCARARRATSAATSRRAPRSARRSCSTR
ncbi:MAG: phosphodiester glycosidase family protein [Sandaracinaceae bacterium]|nr:phosphodiester glycosidase family protein [Sandaracinaceae bacterium]